MSAGHPVGRLLSFSPHETARFGLRIFRGAADFVDVDALIRELERERVDVAILRTPADASEFADVLARRGIHSIIADTLVHYSADLHARPVGSNTEITVRLRRAGSDDVPRLEAIVREIFDGYLTHYHANRLFAPELVLGGYVEWAIRHALANGEGRFVWMVEVDGQEAGFSCVEISADGNEARGVLNGILPTQRGRGIYRDMLRAMFEYFIAARVSRFVISTQAHNTIVQHVWRDEHIAFERSENTIHVNALLGNGAPTGTAVS